MTDDETLDLNEELDNPESSTESKSMDEIPEVSADSELNEPEAIEEIAEPEVLQVEDEIDKLKEELKDEKAKSDELKDRMLRIQADFENYKKRTQREKEDIAEYTKSELLKKLLPVLDNFDLALSHSSTDNPEAYKKGVELVSKQLRDVLDSEGLKEIEAEGKEFNPNYHHGVAVDQNPDVEDQHVTEVFQKGYELNGKVIRPSMVKVNQK